MPKHTYYVKGMHCASCEIVIEKELLSVPGVKFADASLAKGEVDIGYDGERPGMKKLNEKFGKMGYELSEAPFKQNKKEFWKIAAAVLASIGAFLLITELGFSSLISVSSESAPARILCVRAYRRNFKLRRAGWRVGSFSLQALAQRIRRPERNR